MTKINPDNIKIIYAEPKYIPSFYDALKIVAAEKIYIEMIKPPPIEKVVEFQENLISKGGPVFYALDQKTVIGWCDVSPLENPRLNHRGGMGMGLLPGYRGKGLGTKLLEKAINHSAQIGLEKIELSVYTINKPAIALYKKLGFVEEGIIKKYRLLDGQYFDCLSMAKFI